MSTEAGLWALVLLLAVLVVILLALLVRAHQSNESSAAKSQPVDDSRGVTPATSTVSQGKVVPEVADASAATDGLRRRNAGNQQMGSLEAPQGASEACQDNSAEVVTAPMAGPRSPSRLQLPSRQEPSREKTSDASEDEGNRYEASLERSGSAVAWGFAWNVAALAMKRLILAGVDPASPAGAWNAKRKEDGCQPMQRGDEVVAVNQVTTYSEMRKELATPAVEIQLKLVIEAASSETSQTREALRRRREAASSKASSASGMGSNDSSPLHTRSPKSEDPSREDSSSKPRSPIQVGDHVKVRNTFIEVSGELPQEEGQSAERFTQSDPTPVLDMMRATATTTATAGGETVTVATPSSQAESVKERSPDSPSPGRRKPTPLSEPDDVEEEGASDVPEYPSYPAASPAESGEAPYTSWIPETPEAFGLGGHPLLLQHLLPDDGPTSPSLEMIGGVQTLGEGSHHFSDYADYSGATGPALGMPPTSPPLSFPPPAVLSPQSHASTVPVLQYSPPQMGHQLSPEVHQESVERLSPEIGQPQARWTNQTLPLPPGALPAGALPPGPVRATSPIISEASIGPSDASPAVQASPNESEESETEVTSPESRRKPTRRGGRRARHRKLAALARQQAAEAAEAPNAEEAEADYSPPTAGISMVPTLPEAGDRLFSPEVAPSMSSTSSPIYAGLGVATEVDGAQLIGCTVLIQGLVRSPEFNGQWGYVESYDPLMQRYLVSVVLPTQLPGEAPLYAKLRRDNLIVPRPEVHPIPSPVPTSSKVHWPAEPAFVQEPFMQSIQASMGLQATAPGPAADFEDSVGAALMTPIGCRIIPGSSLEDSGSPQTSPLQDSWTASSKPSLGLGTQDPVVLSPDVQQMWLNQGTAADFEDSVAGQLFDSPKAASRGGLSPVSKLKRFGGGYSYAEGTAADFEDSIGGTLTGWPDLLHQRREDSTSTASNTGSSWQPSLRPRGSGNEA